MSHDLWSAFSHQAARHPDAVALVFDESEVTFAALREMALRAAEGLRLGGASLGDIIALQLPKRPIAYALMLGCLHIGAPYVFIDPRNPPERTAKIVARLKPRLLFAESEADNPHGVAVLLSATQGEAWLPPASSGIPDAPARLCGTDPAYIMFTSGSTGEPKGAVIPHQGVLSLISWARSMGYGGTTSRLAAVSPLHFDNSVFDNYCGLFTGAALVPIETAEVSNPATWVRLLRKHRATMLFAVPTLFMILDQLGLLTPVSLPDMQTFQFGGEGFPVGKLRELRARFPAGVRFVNVYGPTETSCICSSLEIDAAALAGPDTSFPSLGRMNANFSYAVRGDDGTAVRRGDAGELWIGGPCVGLGYYGNPQETESRFCQSPDQSLFRDICYRTGDLVREDDDGRLWFQGRVDNQIKIRGHRIELEEVDLAMQGHADVDRAVAVACDGPDGLEIVAAYSADAPLPNSVLAAWCGDRLPTYMKPARFVWMSELPVNANGKIDRKAVRVSLTDGAARGQG